MAGRLFIDANNWFYKISLPKQQLSVFWWTYNICILELGKRCNIWDFKLTEFGNITF